MVYIANPSFLFVTTDDDGDTCSDPAAGDTLTDGFFDCTNANGVGSVATDCFEGDTGDVTVTLTIIDGDDNEDTEVVTADCTDVIASSAGDPIDVTTDLPDPVL